MQIDEAIDLADEWARHLTPHVQDGWRVACKVLADEVRRLRARLAELEAQEPVAWAQFTERGLIQIWSKEKTDLNAVTASIGKHNHQGAQS